VVPIRYRGFLLPTSSDFFSIISAMKRGIKLSASAL
jgi:hypothetical protein